MKFKDEPTSGMNTLLCGLCDKTFLAYGRGNNGDPLTDKPCCDHCNMTRVIPARFAQHKKSWN